MKKIIILLAIAFSAINANAQTWQWAKSSGGTANDGGNGVCVDASGNTYVTGSFLSSSITFGSTTLTNTGGLDMFVVKYDASGNVLWAKAGTGPSNDVGYNITVDANGNVYIVGTSNSSIITLSGTALNLAGYDDVFLAKYDASGTLLWAKKAGGADNDIGQNIAVDANGNTFITGYFASNSINFSGTSLTNAGGNDIFLAKYDVSGTLLWVKSAGGSAAEIGLGVSTDANGNAYITGDFSSSTLAFGSTTLTNGGAIDFYIAKYDAAGAVVWAKRAGGVSNDVGYGLKVDASGNSYVVGTFNSSSLVFGTTTLNTAGGDDIFLVKYDVSGNVLWAKKVGGTGNDIGASISIDGSGNSCITGYYATGSIVFGSITLTNAGSNDIYIAQYDASGNVLGAKSVGGTGDDRGNSIAVDGLGDLFVTGYFASTTAAFGTTTLTNAGGNDLYTAKLSGITAGIEQEKNIIETALIFPNPTNGLFELQIKDAQNLNSKTEIIITDMIGREVYRSSDNFQNSSIKIDISNQVAGMYYVTVINNGKQYRNKVTVSK